MNATAKAILKNLVNEDPEINFKIQAGIEKNRKGFGTIKLSHGDGKPVKKAEIRLTQTAHEFRFGCNSFMLGQFPESGQNALYEEKFRELFNLAVVPFYWSDLEPEDGKPRFGRDSAPVYRRPPPDMVLDFCEKYGITPKGHLLCWHSFVPQWLSREKGRSAERLERRIRELAERYAERIKVWDVANEALQWDPEYSEPMPERHVETAFEMAGKYFPESTELLYNEGPFVSWANYHGDYTPLYMLAKSLLNDGLPMKGLGLQYHMFAGLENMTDWSFNFTNQRYLYAIMDQYAKLGVPFNVSEITVTARRDLGDGDEFQRLATEKLYRLWFSHPASNGIVWWNLVDGTAAYSPMGSEEGENQYRGGLLNFDFSEKPAYKAVSNLLKKEWNTRLNVEYEDGAENKFHGFYGDYDAVVKTDNGTFRKKLKLAKDGVNKFNLETEYTL